MSDPGTQDPVDATGGPAPTDASARPAASDAGTVPSEAGAVPSDAGTVLLPLARARIARELGLASAEPETPAWLTEPGAAFVTLTQGGTLRGCIGSLQAYRSLQADVEGNAIAAAFRDPRFPPLAREELRRTEIEVSVLSPEVALRFDDEADAIQQLRPGVDGVILVAGRHRGTFLPQVWEKLPDPHQFFRQLKAKAGLPADYWSDQVRLSRYTVRAWEEGHDPERSR